MSTVIRIKKPSIPVYRTRMDGVHFDNKYEFHTSGLPASDFNPGG